MDEGCNIGISKINILAYADDIALVANSVKQMSLLYNKLKCRLQGLGLQLNKGKTKCLLFGSSGKQDYPKSVVLAEDKLEVVFTYKYLGHFIERTLRDDKDIENELMKFYASTNSVLRNFRNVDTVLFLFTSYCKPIYGLTLWDNKSSSN